MSANKKIRRQINENALTLNKEVAKHISIYLYLVYMYMCIYLCVCNSRLPQMCKGNCKKVPKKFKSRSQTQHCCSLLKISKEDVASSSLAAQRNEQTVKQAMQAGRKYRRARILCAWHEHSTSKRLSKRNYQCGCGLNFAVLAANN